MNTQNICIYEVMKKLSLNKPYLPLVYCSNTYSETNTLTFRTLIYLWKAEQPEDWDDLEEIMENEVRGQG